MLRTLLLIFAVSFAANGQPLAATATDHPNIVLLVADDLGYGELGCQGNPEIPTPHIDSIAAQGTRFTNGYVTAAFCSASRAGFLTGRYQTRFGHEFNPTGAWNEDPKAGLPVGQRTLGDLLHDIGYATALIGKWHLGGTAHYHPQRRGFDEFYGFLHEGHYFVPPPYAGVSTMLRRKMLPGNKTGRWTNADGRLTLSTHMGNDEPDYDANNPILRGSQPVAEPDYLTDALTRESVSFIQRHTDRPFFLYVPYNAVHSPLQATDQDVRRFGHINDLHRRIFAGMLHRLDQSVGQILSTIQQHDLERDTLLIFISDNGGPTRELTSSNRPLRGEKGMLYEGGIRVPFMMKWPGHVPTGTVYHNAVISVDIVPTALAAAGMSLPRNQEFDGVDLLPYLRNTAIVPHETLYWRTGARAALRHGDWKLVRNPRRGGSLEWQLYNLSNDLSETKDLASQDVTKRDQLIELWESLNAQMIEPAWQR